MALKRSSKFSRSSSIVDYILEGDGHTIAEATEEFGLCETSIRRDLNYYGSIAFYGNVKNEIELQTKYRKVLKTLARLADENRFNSKSSKKSSL